MKNKSLATEQDYLATLARNAILRKNYQLQREQELLEELDSYWQDHWWWKLRQWVYWKITEHMER